ncbi:MAG: Panacea domain-containing protein [Candidatus Egerieousia sp.]
MSKLFKYEKAVNSLLYALQKLGGKTDMHKLCKILYFADQRHLSKYGRSITGDSYIAMQFGPVPSYVDDILKALRGDSFFSSSNEIEPLKECMVFENRFIIRCLKNPDMDELSVSDIECLDYAIEICKNKNFAELTEYSHGLAWNNTQKDRTISVKDILREVGDDESYVDYIADNLKLQSSFL